MLILPECRGRDDELGVWWQVGVGEVSERRVPDCLTQNIGDLRRDEAQLGVKRVHLQVQFAVNIGFELQRVLQVVCGARVLVVCKVVTHQVIHSLYCIHSIFAIEFHPPHTSSATTNKIKAFISLII